MNGGLTNDAIPAFAEFKHCGQGIREGGDVKLRGVLVGRIGSIERQLGSNCRIQMRLFPASMEQIPENSGAQIRAKTVFGEKWVELLYPESPEGRIAENDTITADRTIDPLEVETILNTALPILDAIDPEHLAGALTALAEGFVGHEDAAIRGLDRGIVSLKSFNENEALLAEGIRQLAESGEVLEDVDAPLLEAMSNLTTLNRFTSSRSQLIAENLRKTPILLRELSTVFETRFVDLTKIVDQGATVIGVLAARTDDLDRLLDALPKFNSGWIRNLNHVCRFRQPTNEPGKTMGERVPGRCWRVHNIVSESRGPYEPGEGPRPGQEPTDADYRALGVEQVDDVTRLLFKPAIAPGGRR
ncbi:MAG: MCE family protein [Actinomycetota bacterium]|nr:MCE family protein [Actinomycetota bacterium]